MPKIRNEASFLRTRQQSINSEIERVRTRSSAEIERLEQHQKNLEQAIAVLEGGNPANGRRRRRGRPPKAR